MLLGGSHCMASAVAPVWGPLLPALHQIPCSAAAARLLSPLASHLQSCHTCAKRDRPLCRHDAPSDKHGLQADQPARKHETWLLHGQKYSSMHAA